MKSRLALTILYALICPLIAMAVPVIAQPKPVPMPHTTSILNPDGTYSNPPGSPRAYATWWDFQKFFWGRIVFGGTPKVPAGFVMTPAQAANGWSSIKGDKLQWFGHSAFRMEISGTTILTDPFLTLRASPFQWAGPKRFAPSPLAPQDAAADLILITHNHYDHLDLETLKNLPNRATVHVIVPLGVGHLIHEAGIPNVTELDWHQTVTFNGLAITLTPSVHFSARWTNDRNRTLWGGYVIRSANLTVYQTGDTAYHPTLFKEIGREYGPMDYALVPIGAYEPRSIMLGSHTTPEEGVQIGQDVSATTILGHHWGAVVLTTEPPFEPPVRFQAAAQASGFTSAHAWLLKIGETRPLARTK